jgi:hypothetical protein
VCHGCWPVSKYRADDHTLLRGVLTRRSQVCSIDRQNECTERQKDRAQPHLGEVRIEREAGRKEIMKNFYSSLSKGQTNEGMRVVKIIPDQVPGRKC